MKKRVLIEHKFDAKPEFDKLLIKRLKEGWLGDKEYRALRDLRTRYPYYEDTIEVKLEVITDSAHDVEITIEE